MKNSIINSVTTVMSITMFIKDDIEQSIIDSDVEIAEAIKNGCTEFFCSIHTMGYYDGADDDDFDQLHIFLYDQNDPFEIVLDYYPICGEEDCKNFIEEEIEIFTSKALTKSLEFTKIPLDKIVSIEVNYKLSKTEKAYE